MTQKFYPRQYRKLLRFHYVTDRVKMLVNLIEEKGCYIGLYEPDLFHKKCVLEKEFKGYIYRVLIKNI